MGGSASSAGLGGAGAWIRSLRPAQYSVPGLVLPAGEPSSRLTAADPGLAGGLAAGALPPEAQPATTSTSVNVQGQDRRGLTSCLPSEPGRTAPAARA